MKGSRERGSSRRSRPLGSVLRATASNGMGSMSTHMRRIRALVIFTIVCAFPAFAGAEKKIEIGALVPLTGNWAAIGKNVQQGISLAVKELNSDGGIDGVPLAVNFQDTDEEKTGTKV